ncbi:MAG: hypothetical protein DME25_04685 [Verrucomicrobia bacterium]|nr:MAG: hypothetical protein DME25_04685 [Verrucomicrobiota bacterium]
MNLARASIAFDRKPRFPDGRADAFDKWLRNWHSKLTHFAEGGGGSSWETYDVEGPVEAIKAIPQEIQSSSQWTDPPKVGRGGRRSIRYSK